MSAWRPSPRTTVAPRSSSIPSRLDAGGERAAAGVGPQVGDGDDAHARGVQRERGVEAAVAGRGDDGRVARLDAVERGEPARAAREHHAGQVVVGEHERLLERAGRGDVARGADLVQRVALPDGHQPVEEPERRRAAEDLHAGRRGALGQRARPRVAALVQQGAAGLGVLVAEHDVGAQLGGAQRRREAGDAAADHEHVAVAAAVLGAPLALGLPLRQHAEAGGRAQHLLVDAATAAAGG